MKKTARSYNSTLRGVSDKQKKELALRSKVKMQLIFMFGNKCMICGKRPDWRGLSLSHEIPLSQGGKTDVFNCKLRCGRCHSAEHGIKESDG